MPPSAKLEWESRGEDYRRDVSFGPSSSAWLRDALLKPAVVALLGDRIRNRVLDVGTGGGWLFETITVGDAYACDIARPERIPNGVKFVEADVAALPYENNMFDAVVASIVLCYCSDLAKVAAELHRVTALGGTLVVAQVHPFFYRTGHPQRNDAFLVERDLADKSPIEILIGQTAGPFTYYPHSVADYVNALMGEGWRLTSMSDLFIPKDEYERDHRATDRVLRSTRVPIFTTMAFDKPFN